jgi:hypothetical protein
MIRKRERRDPGNLEGTHLASILRIHTDVSVAVWGSESSSVFLHLGTGPQPQFEICIQKYMNRTLLPGRPYPLGATVSSKGTNFAIFSQDATRVDLCLFNTEGKQTDCIALRERTAFVWHGFIQDVKPGQLYGGRQRRGTASTTTSFLWTLTPKPSRARSTGRRQYSLMMCFLETI